MQPQAAIVITHGGPHAGALEQFVAEYLPHTHRVVLEPLEVQFAHALYGVVIVVDIFAQVHTEVRMVPVGVVALMGLAPPALGAAARGVALDAQAHAVDDGGLTVLDERQGGHDVLGGVGIGVIECQQPVPLAQAHAEVYLGHGATVPHIVVALLDMLGE